VNVSSFTAGADYRVFATTLTGFNGGSAGALTDIITSGGTTMLEAEDEDGTIGSASNTGDTIVVIVGVDPKRGAPEWNVIAGIGVFTGFFIITL
jgi:hypothetical protein